MGETYDTAADLRERARQLHAEADALRGSAQNIIVTVRDTLRTNLATRPYVTLAAVAGVGYLLGGGLTPRLARSLVVTGMRMAAGTIANEMLAAATRPTPPLTTSPSDDDL
ncbi:MAG: hypothetical protein HUU55_04230 [Myxococcales bacterium]|nr:hypothetical protein [Myxococcales bacterium]